MHLKWNKANQGTQEQQVDCEAMVCEHYEQVYQFLAYLSRNRTCAEDLTQETYLAAFANLKDFRKQASVSTWLHKIAYNKFLDYRRRSQLNERKLSELACNSGDKSQSPLVEVLRNENAGRLYRAISKLEEQYNILIVLHYFQSKSLSEISTILCEPVGTIKSRTHQALEIMRKTLKEV